MLALADQLGVHAFDACDRREVTYFACDLSEEHEDTCRRVGIEMTPTLGAGGCDTPGSQLRVTPLARLPPAAFAGLRMPGQAPVAEVSRLLTHVDNMYDTLRERGAELYGREGCVWTQRQRALIGPRADAVTYIDCDREARRCADAGAVAVPAWRLRGEGAKSPIVLGFQRLPQLQDFAYANKAGLERISKRSFEGAAAMGGGEACV